MDHHERAPLPGNPTIAIVHDYLTQYGGAERVVEALHDRFPDAPIFTSLWNPAAFPPAWHRWDIRTTPLQRLPGGSRAHRLFLPAYPAAFRALRRSLEPFDLVIASSSAWAHHAPVRDDATLACYCHSPARFLYGDSGYLEPAGLPPGISAIAPALLASLRGADQRAARRVDRYLANSATVRDRIAHAYGRDATVVYPPIDTKRFRPSEPVAAEEWYLVVSRLVPHKRIDLAITGAALAGKPLRVVGSGRAADSLRELAGPPVTFLGELADSEVASLMQRCRALVVPGEEDFGMTIVEAQAAGRPVIAFGRGGATETVRAGETGVLFPTQDAAAVADAIGDVERGTWDSVGISASAERFNRDRFFRELDRELAIALAGRG